MIIKVFTKVGVFAENKDIAKDLRLKILTPALKRGETVVINFEKVEGATQSFIHALISELMRQFGSEILDQIQFQGCNETIKAIISIVVDYMQESDESS